MGAAVLPTDLSLVITMTAQNEDFTATRAGLVIDAWLTSVAGAGGDTVTVQRQALGAGAFNAVSSAMACADALGTIARTTLAAVAQDAIAATDVVRAAGSAVGTRGNVYIPVLFAALP